MSCSNSPVLHKNHKKSRKKRFFRASSQPALFTKTCPSRGFPRILNQERSLGRINMQCEAKSLTGRSGCTKVNWSTRAKLRLAISQTSVRFLEMIPCTICSVKSSGDSFLRVVWELAVWDLMMKDSKLGLPCCTDCSHTFWICH